MLRRGLIGGASAAILARAALAQVGPVGGPIGRQFPRSGPGGYGGPGPGASGGGPSLDLNFIDGSAFNPGITFTRSTVASYFDVAGTMQSAAINTPRIDYDPVTHAIRGLLIEEGRTNLLLNSATLVTQSVTVTAQAYTLSFYGTGTVTLTGTSTAGPLVGTGAFPARVPLTFTPTAGTLTLTVTGSVLNAQLEAGAIPTSWITTAGATVGRGADIATMPWVVIFPASAAVDAMLPQSAPVGFPQGLVLFDDGTSTNRAILRNISTVAIGGAYVTAGSGTAVATASGIYTAGTPFKAAQSMLSGSILATLNGATPVLGSGAAPSGLTTMRIGQNTTSGNYSNGYIRRVRYWPRALSSGELQVATT